MRRVTIAGLLARKLRLALTALAIILGVTFVTGTLVLGDTLNRSFDSLVGTAFSHISFEIRGQATLSGVAAGGVDGTTDRRPIPASVLTRVRRVPGVAFADGSVSGYAQFVAPDGDAIGGGGSSALGFSFDPDAALSSIRLVAGTAPTSAHDVVMDRATATKYGFAIGDRVRVLLPGPPQTFTVTGVVTFGTDGSLAGATLAGFALPAAQALFRSRGVYDTIDVLAAPGSDDVTLQRAIARVLPAGVEVVSGRTVAGELYRTISNDLSFLSTALLIFAFISLFVGAFTIVNTFSITIGQRTRELALLRVVGASRRQVFRSVLGEAALTGLAASLVGLGLGVGAAAGLEAVLRAFGIALPAAPLVFSVRTPVTALAVGVGVTVGSAIAPARRAVRIAPVAALVDRADDPPRSMRRRLIAGAVIALAGLAIVIAGLIEPAVALVGAGAVAVFTAAALLHPLVARPLAGALGRPLAAMLGSPGRLGRANAMRDPRRTAQTAAALMIGLALVSAIAVLGASLSSSARHSVDAAIDADYIISGQGGFSTAIAPAVSRLTGAGVTTTVYQGQFDVRGAPATLVAATPAELSRTVTLHVTAGRAGPAMAAGELLVDTTTASEDGLHVGSTIAVTFAQTGATRMRIGGIFAPNPLVGSFVVGAGFFVSHFDDPLPTSVLVSAAPGAGGHGLERAINALLEPYANVGVQTRAQFEHAQQSKVDQELGLVYVLLALAVVIALIGIVNTLMLSVFERTHELGLLRALGARRRQIRTMIRAESVIIALFGAVVGVVIGAALGIALAVALRHGGVTALAVPVAGLAGLLVLAGLLGIAAAGWPARRAARLDVLAAIAAQ